MEKDISFYKQNTLLEEALILANNANNSKEIFPKSKLYDVKANKNYHRHYTIQLI